MTQRLDYYQASPATIDSLSAFSAQLAKSFADPKLKALVELRVSQINGCAFCIDMHSTEARKLGEHTQRLDCLPVWREVSFYTDREKAAFAWAEAVTLISHGGVSDEVYAQAKAHFTDEQLTVLTAVIGAMNMWNRFSISFHKTPPTRTQAAGTRST
jgi:AhpD family alkylhydroperoxidase